MNFSRNEILIESIKDDIPSIFINSVDEWIQEIQCLLIGKFVNLVNDFRCYGGLKFYAWKLIPFLPTGHFTNHSLTIDLEANKL